MLNDAQNHSENFNPLPRKEGDLFLRFILKLHFDFNPLPRKEGDRLHPNIVSSKLEFQSTPS